MARGRAYPDIRRNAPAGAGAARAALDRFRGRLTHARRDNDDTLRFVLGLNADTEFGRRHGFLAILAAADIASEFRQRVPLMEYADLAPYVDRIQAGAQGVLTTDPVHMLAGTSGTTDRPKRIPRTRRAQRQSLEFISLVQRAVIEGGIPGADAPGRGINLMSLAAAPAPDTGTVPVMAGPSAGMASIRHLIPVRWCAPALVHEVADPNTALYLHALFALRERDALYIETPFAPQLTGWLALMERHAGDLVRDLAGGTLASHLVLTPNERRALEADLPPDPGTARVVAGEFTRGFQGIIPRLWSRMAYLRTITSGSFSLTVPRLRWLAGPDLPIQSGCHASSEGVIGLNLRTDGSTDYVLAIGTAFFEFIPVASRDGVAPTVVDLPALEVGAEYELVLTSCAGLYRYRLGDVVRITGWVGEAPTFEFLYRRGTLLNLVGEKTSEFHTAQALATSLSRWLGVPHPIKDYTVVGRVADGQGRYTFYVELIDGLPVPPGDPGVPVGWLDQALGDVNPYYRSSGRQTLRLGLPELRIVRSGTFASLLAQQRVRAAPASSSQVKTPRRVSLPEQLALLEEGTVVRGTWRRVGLGSCSSRN